MQKMTLMNREHISVILVVSLAAVSLSLRTKEGVCKLCSCEHLNTGGNQSFKIDCSRLARNDVDGLLGIGSPGSEVAWIVPYEGASAGDGYVKIVLDSNVIQRLGPLPAVRVGPKTANGMNVTSDPVSEDDAANKTTTVLSSTTPASWPDPTLHIEISFRGNHIKEIEPGTFASLSKTVWSIDLAKNDLTFDKIPPSAFRGDFSNSRYEPLVGLKQLNLARNMLHSLDPKLFEHVSSTLEELNLQGNQFGSKLDMGTEMALSTLHKLKTLNLGDLGLSSYPEGLANALISLENLRLDGNKFTVVPHALSMASSSLRYLNLNRNPIEKINSSSFVNQPGHESSWRKLETIDLSAMPGLTYVLKGAFENLPALQKLRCTFNQRLIHFDEEAFRRMRDDETEEDRWKGFQLKELELQGNGLQWLSPNLIPWSKLDSADLQANPWFCDCSLKPLANAIRVFIWTKAPNMSTGLLCSLPDALAGVNFLTTHSDLGPNGTSSEDEEAGWSRNPHGPSERLWSDCDNKASRMAYSSRGAIASALGAVAVTLVVSLAIVAVLVYVVKRSIRAERLNLPGQVRYVRAPPTKDEDDEQVIMDMRWPPKELNTTNGGGVVLKSSSLAYGWPRSYCVSADAGNQVLCQWCACVTDKSSWMPDKEPGLEGRPHKSDPNALLVNCSGLHASPFAGDYVWPDVPLQNIPDPNKSPDVPATRADFSSSGLNGVMKNLPVKETRRLRELSLAHNQITTILPGSLTGLPALMLLDLSHNKLANLPQDTLPLASDPSTASNLKVLLLSHNEFLKFPWEARLRLPMLEWLDVSSNFIKSLENGFNGKKEDLTFKTIEVLNLKHNRLTELSSNAASRFPNLKVLDLSWNSILVVPDAFLAQSNSTFRNLSELNLDGNPIKRLGSNSFLGSPFLHLLSLSASAELSEISSEAFDGLEDLRVLKLRKNILLSRLPAKGILREVNETGGRRALEEVGCSKPRWLLGRRFVHWLGRSNGVYCGHKMEKLRMGLFPQEELVSLGASTLPTSPSFHIPLAFTTRERPNSSPSSLPASPYLLIPPHYFWFIWSGGGRGRGRYGNGSMDNCLTRAETLVLLPLVLSSTLQLLQARTHGPHICKICACTYNNSTWTVPPPGNHDSHKPSFIPDSEALLVNCSGVPVSPFSDGYPWPDVPKHAHGAEDEEPDPRLPIVPATRANFASCGLSGAVRKFPGTELRKLQELSLAYNAFTHVDAGSLAGLHSLILLDLGHNNLSTLNPDSLPSVTNASSPLASSLRDVRLNHNLFKGFPWDAVRRMPKLERIDLSYNLIGSLNDNSVTNAGIQYKNLTVLLLSHNGLLEFPKEVAQCFPQLRVLDLSWNELEAVPGVLTTQSSSGAGSAIGPLQHLKELYLDGNLIKVLGPNAFAGAPFLHFLSVSETKSLTKVTAEAFDGLLMLKTLHLRENVHLSRLPDEGFLRQVRQNKKWTITEVDLSYNTLERISKDFLPWQEVKVVDLQGNPWNCNCSLQWMLDELTPHLHKENSSFLYDLRCAKPARLRGHRFVRWMGHSDGVFCGRSSPPLAPSHYERMGSTDVEDVQMGMNTGMLVAIVVLGVALVAVSVAAIVLQRRVKKRERQLKQRKPVARVPLLKESNLGK
ncbi:uncharacterized protein LOC124153236 [Ischnura elegans]|uniref:uncharacterized protein LOC124153236 n=1 Tax=Ischnura elegans TaxID=197161 RepID=UPI001ED8AE5B|nr:uncharacterized protein LOC124153236 [Ischnura elegans]